MLFPLRTTTSKVGLLPSLSTKVSPAATVCFYPTKYLCPSATESKSNICVFGICSVHNNGPVVHAFCGCGKFLLVAVSCWRGAISHTRRGDVVGVLRPVCILMKLTSQAHLPSPVCLPLFLVSRACVPAQANKHTLAHFGGLIVLQLFEQQQQQTFHLVVTESLLAGFCISSTGTVTLGGSSC